MVICCKERMIQVGQLDPGNRRGDLERPLHQRENRADDQRRADAGADAEKRLPAKALQLRAMDQAQDDGANEVEASHGQTGLDQVQRACGRSG
jgi:hypothetical protein